MVWFTRFVDPIVVPDGRELLTLRDAAEYITAVPKAEHEAADWQVAWSPRAMGRKCFADRGHEGEEQKRTAVSGCWRAFTSNWREITRYDPPFRLDISVGLTCKQAYARAADQNGRI